MTGPATWATVASSRSIIDAATTTVNASQRLRDDALPGGGVKKLMTLPPRFAERIIPFQFGHEPGLAHRAVAARLRGAPLSWRRRGLSGAERSVPVVFGHDSERAASAGGGERRAHPRRRARGVRGRSRSADRRRRGARGRRHQRALPALREQGR